MSILISMYNRDKEEEGEYLNNAKKLRTEIVFVDMRREAQGG